MPTLDLQTTIDPDSAAWAAAARTLQGNIAKPHGREHTAILLFVIAERGAARARLRDLAETFVTSAEEQRRQAEARAGDPNTVFGNLGLSGAGYRKLGYSETELEEGFRRRYGRDWFLDGMDARAQDLGDTGARQEEFYNREAVDGYLLMACEDSGVLERAVRAARERLQWFCGAIHEERGQVLRQNGEVREPFGFRDGIAMPTIFGGQRGESLLFEDRLAQREGSYGTFVVYRKLEQDVAGFAASVQRLAAAAQITEDHAAAMIMGRYKDGTPLAADFAQDSDGSQCPFHAHIRKVNPQVTPQGRKATIPLYRRSTPYALEGKQGLLFLAMQAHIAKSFGVMVRTWVNNPNFPDTGAPVGTDSLLGVPGGTQNWNDTPFDVGRHVAFRGGEFFFLPSLAFFANLGS